MEKSRKKSNQFTGLAGETVAKRYLEEQGFEVLHCNWRYGRTETDIIACNQGVLHFIEVKSASGNQPAYPEHHVNRAKLEQMKRGAAGFLEQYPEWKHIQFDIVSVTFKTGSDPDVFWIKDVF